MSDEEKLLKLTNINGKEQLYYGGLQIVNNISMVEIEKDLYVVRDNAIVLSTGKKSILSLVKSGKQVYFRS